MSKSGDQDTNGQAMNLDDAAQLIRCIPDFPKPEILFRDISPLLASGPAMQVLNTALVEHVSADAPDAMVGIESRGFGFAAAMSDRLKIGWVPVRKKGKLPGDVIRHNYVLEYGTNTLEMQVDALKRGAKVWIVDNLLGTGGTVGAAIELVNELGGTVLGVILVIELKQLGGRKALIERYGKNLKIVSVWAY